MSCFFIFIVNLCCVASQAQRHFNVKTGASVTIPCGYNRKYIQNKKYWCSGRYFNSCKIQAYTNQTKDRVTVTDNPAENLFTVTMNNLQPGDTGWYWCAVQIGDITEPDVKEYLYITVKPDLDLYVKESRVRGEKGGSITVQCHYRKEYNNKQKQWCRFKDKNCNTFQRSETSQNSSLQLSDDGRGSFSVTMSRLKKSDAGWYWCGAGDLQVPVHISVSDPPPVMTKTLITTTHHVRIYTSVRAHISASPMTSVSSSEETIGSETVIYWYLMAFLFVLVILIIIICILRIKCNNKIRTRMKCNDTPVHTPTDEMTEVSAIYSTVSHPNVSASKVNEQNTTYLNITVRNSIETVSPKDVDDKIIYSTVVC